MFKRSETESSDEPHRYDLGVVSMMNDVTKKVNGISNDHKTVKSSFSQMLKSFHTLISTAKEIFSMCGK